MASKLNILACDDACTSCIKAYKKKHNLHQGDSFKINCTGIPKQYVSASMLESISDENTKSMLSMLDPVTWAAEVLDWHCIDPDGEIWKRKTLEGTLGEVTPYIEDKYSELVKQGKSAYNRPYQVEMLRCTSKRKVFRIGRQCGKTETLCISILHSAFTHKEYRVVIITPYQTQIDLIFSRLSKLIGSSSTTKNSVKRYVKAPNYTIELHNGSVIRGFTAGTKSGGNADAVRGQKANMLVFDEADYLSSGDMASALAVITNYPDATVWMSSTPCGKREKFYEACKSPLYKEFYYPSWVNPLWSDDLEEFYRGEFTDIQYTHEVAADFGEQEQGVYQSAYVDDAMADYHYSEMSVNPDTYIYMMGVDWNDFKIGTTIAVVGYNPPTNTFKLVSRFVVQKEGWTQHAAIEKIIELNAYWNPAYIYVDRGFGSTQIEIMKKFGFDSVRDPNKGSAHPDARLHKIVKEYDFGSKVTIKDLFSKQDIDKPAKPFLVENSVRRFEQRQFQFSKYDTQLEAELRGYIIDHITSVGYPVYAQSDEKIGDHNLDAVNLALVGFTLQMSEFGKPVLEFGMAFVPPNVPKNPNDKQLILPKLGDNKNQKKPDSNFRPNMGRTKVLENPTSYQGAPAANTNKNTGKIWSWPGFERDEPRPTRGNIGGPPRRVQLPVRKKF